MVDGGERYSVTVAKNLSFDRFGSSTKTSAIGSESITSPFPLSVRIYAAMFGVCTQIHRSAKAVLCVT